MAEIDYVQLTTREVLSGIFGSISLACWIFLLVRISLLRSYSVSEI